MPTYTTIPPGGNLTTPDTIVGITPVKIWGLSTVTGHEGEGILAITINGDGTVTFAEGIVDLDIVGDLHVEGETILDQAVTIVSGGLSVTAGGINVVAGGVTTTTLVASTSATSPIVGTTATNPVYIPGTSIASFPSFTQADASPTSDAGWASLADCTGARATGSGLIGIARLDLKVGTALTAIGVKYQGSASDDGVKIELVRRDESGNATAWSVLDASANQTNTAVTNYTLTLGATRTVEANYTYAIRVTSEVGTTGATVFALFYTPSVTRLG